MKAVVYEDDCGRKTGERHFAIAFEEDAVFRAVDHVGAFYAHFIESFSVPKNVDFEELLKNYLPHQMNE